MADIKTKVKPYEILYNKGSKLTLASFHYYEGIKYVKERNFKQTTLHKDLLSKKHFMVTCSSVCIIVDDTQFPDIERLEY